jgi:hypothetical protein
MNNKPFKITLALLFFVLCVLSVEAQSGRRKTPPPPAAPIPTPTPEPTPTPKKEGAKAELIFLVGTDRHSDSGLIPLGFHTAAQRGCADRLRSRSSAEVDAPHGDMGRGQAIEKAKKSTNTYVVLISLKLDTTVNTDEVILDFVVFAPTTSKVVLTGRTYVTGHRAGPVVVNPTRRLPAGVYREEWLRNAGEEAADKVLKKLNLGGPAPK